MLLAGDQLPRPAGLALIGTAALLHGLAHGAELPAGGVFAAYAAALHVAGLGLGEVLRRLHAVAWRLAGRDRGLQGQRRQQRRRENGQGQQGKAHRISGRGRRSNLESSPSPVVQSLQTAAKAPPFPASDNPSDASLESKTNTAPGGAVGSLPEGEAMDQRAARRRDIMPMTPRPASIRA